MFHELPPELAKDLYTVNDYDSVSRRLEDSFELIDLIKSCLSTPENLVHLRPQVEEKSSKMGGATLRVKIIRLQRDNTNDSDSPTATKSLKQIVQIYRVGIVDLEKRGFLMIKRAKNKSLTLLDDQPYVVDRTKVCINKKGEVVITSSHQTVIHEEIDDTFTVQSLEMSQR